MARVEGVDLPKDKRVEIGLTYIYGIGRSSAQNILEKTNIDPNIRVQNLTEKQIAQLRQVIDEEYIV